MGEYAVVWEGHCFVMPDGLEFHRAICLTTSYMTSYAAVLWPHLLNVQEG